MISTPPSRRELALTFLRLGATAFGGPAAHIALMESELVEKRGWIERRRFLDMLGAVNLIPGPNSTEVAMHIGAELHGAPGLVIAGVCFILPAFLIVLLLAWLYATYGTVPDVTAVLAGVKAAVLAIILQAIWRLRGAVIRGWAPGVLAIAVLVLGLLGVHELILLFGSGAICGAVAAMRARGAESTVRDGSNGPSKTTILLGSSGLFGGLFATATTGSIFLYFLYIGSVLYGSGYVLIAFLRDDLVGGLGWLTERQLLDAVSIGQVTPGPVFTTATFIGYLLGGVHGGIAATVGIFLPSFLFVLFTRRLTERLRERPATSGFLDGVNAAAVALIAVALVLLARGALVSIELWLVAIVSAVILIVTRVNPTWLIVAGGAVGWLVA